MPNSNILVIIGQTVSEFANLRDLLDFVILAMRGLQADRAKELEDKPAPAPQPEVKGQTKAEARIDATIAKIVEPAKVEAPAPSSPAVGSTNSYGLPPMRKPFFGGMDKSNLLSFSYEINGESPRVRPADISRILFTKTEAYRAMPPKERDKVVNWGLTFLKKLVREDHKRHSCETKMAEAYSIDRFSFLQGATVTFTVGIKD